MRSGEVNETQSSAVLRRGRGAPVPCKEPPVALLGWERLFVVSG